MKFWKVLVFLFVIIGLASCSSTLEPDEVTNPIDKTKLSTQQLKKGREEFNEIMAEADHKIEDFEKVIDIWEKGLKYQSQNTLILKEMSKLLFNMGKGYVDRKNRFEYRAQEAKKKKDIALQNKYLAQVKEAEKKAQKCFKRLLHRLNTLLNIRSPQNPQEERNFLRFLVISNIYLKRYQKAREIIESQIRATPEEDPNHPWLQRMKRTLDTALEKMEMDKMEE